MTASTTDIAADSTLQGLIARATKDHLALFKVFGGMGVISGIALALLGVFIPAKPGEEIAKAVVMAFGALAGLGGVAYWKMGVNKAERLKQLVFECPNEIAAMELLIIQRGAIRHCSVRLTDIKGDLVGVTVPTEAYGKDIIGRLRNHGVNG